MFSCRGFSLVITSVLEYEQNNVKFEVFTAVVKNITIFLDIKPCCRARLILDSQDGCDRSLRNVGSRTDYMALIPRRWQHSSEIVFDILCRV
jgi:hypothetical protein